MISQIPADWNPHMKLEFIKVSIRSVTANLVGRNRKELKIEIDVLENTLNEMHSIKIKACKIFDSGADTYEMRNKIVLIDNAICEL